MRAALVVLGFLAVTLTGTWVWLEWGGGVYASVFAPAAHAIYSAVGLDEVVVRPQRLRYINLVPFLGLMLVTPGLGARRRIGGLVIGLLLIFVSHVWLNALAYWIPGGERRLPTAAAVLSDALPFLVWVVIARAPLERYLRRRDDEVRAGPTP